MRNIVLLGGDLVSSLPLPRVLEGFGYGVLSAAEPDDVLYAAVTEEVALVILDLDYPGGGVLELIDTIKESYEALPVVALIGSEDDSDAYLEAAARIGADRCLSRPFELADLHSAISREMRRARQKARGQSRAA